MYFYFSYLTSRLTGGGSLWFPLYFPNSIFFFLSSYLYSKKDIKNFKTFFKKNLIKILLPVALFLILELILCLIVNPTVANPLNWISYISSNIYACGHLWFIYSIILCYITLPFLQIAYNKNHRFRKVTSICLISLFFLESVWTLLLGTNLVFIPFFLGYAYGKYEKAKQEKSNDTEVQNSKSLLIIVNFAILLISYMIYLPAKQLFTPEDPLLNTVSIGIQRISSTGIAVPFSILFLLAFKFLNKYESIKFLSICDRYSFYIYLTHHIFMVGTCSLIYITPYMSVNILIIIALTILSSVALEFLYQLINKKILSRKRQKTDTATKQ